MIVFERPTRCLALRLRPSSFRPQDIRRRDDDVMDSSLIDNYQNDWGRDQSFASRMRDDWSVATAALNCARRPSAIQCPQPLQFLFTLVLGAPLGVATSLPHRPPSKWTDDCRKYDKRQNNIHWIEICHFPALLFVATPLRAPGRTIPRQRSRGSTKLPQMPAPRYSAARASGVS